ARRLDRPRPGGLVRSQPTRLQAAPRRRRQLGGERSVRGGGMIAEHQLGPFRREGLMRRTAPFLVAMILGFAAIALPSSQRDTTEIVIAAALNVALVLAIVVL